MDIVEQGSIHTVETLWILYNGERKRVRIRDDEWMNKQTIFEAIVAAGIEEFPKINQRIVREIIVR
jgi:hypothetical protein